MSKADPEIWRNIIEYVVNRGGNIIRPWFTDLAPVSLQGGLLEILAPGPREAAYLTDNAKRLFTDAAQTATGMLVGVSFLSKMPDQDEDFSSGFGSDDDNNAENQSAWDDTTPVNKDFTFDGFIVGPSSRLAHAACQAVCESPGEAYNPLFIYGDSGLGKTHLMHAICHELLKRRAETKCCLLSCESFVNHFISALEKGDLQQFRYHYRQADVLVIDDVQFLVGRDQTQEEFFHTFNTLHQMRKQIVLSSDRSPAEISGLEQRLVSRFNWGLVAGVDRPCYETRVAIVRTKAQKRGIKMPDNVICLIAGQIDSNIRELEGAIARISMLASVYDREIDLAIASEALGTNQRDTNREISIDKILEVVMSRFSVRLADLQSKKRSRSIALPRQVCMYLARKMTNHSLEEIGGYFGGRDHTTVLHADRNIQKLIDEDGQLYATVENLLRELQS